MSPTASRRRSFLLPALVAFPISIVLLFPCTGAGTGPGRYQDGDWVGYTSVRFVTSAAVSSEYVCFGTRGGILRYDRFRNRWDKTLTSIDGLPSNRIIAVAYDPETSELYARTIAGDALFDAASDRFDPSAGFPDSLAAPWQKVELLNYMLPTGYSALDRGFVSDEHLREYRVQGAITDDWGNLWVGTWGLGVWRGFANDRNLEALFTGLAQSNVMAIEWLGDYLWLAGPRLEGEPGGITVFDTLEQKWTYYEARYTYGLNSDDVFDMARTGDTIWMATAAGLVRYCEQENHPFRTYNEFSGLLSDHVTAVEPAGNVLWVGSDLGLNVLNIPRDSLARAVDRLTRGTYVYDVKAIDDFIWLGTDRGLFRLFTGSTQWCRFSSAEGILDGQVRAIAYDDTAFYFGTDLGLAMVFRDGSGIREYSTGSLLPATDIYALAVTERIIWASTPLGLVRFDPRKEEYRLFTHEDGLFDDFVQVIYPDGDYLWLGTQEGVQRFYWKNPYRID